MGIEENEEMDEDYGSQLTAETPATIDINFILDERSREFYGEGYRWFDLVRTQMSADEKKNYQNPEYR